MSSDDATAHRRFVLAGTTYVQRAQQAQHLRMWAQAREKDRRLVAAIRRWSR